MNLNIALIARDKSWENKVSDELRAVIRKLHGIQVHFVPTSETLVGGSAQIILVDGGMPSLEKVLSEISRPGRAVFLILSDQAATPPELSSGKVDDVLLIPFRALEVQSRFSHYQQILLWDEVTRLNASFTDLLGRLREDLSLAERLQKSRLPLRFPDVKGIKVSSRYLAGTRSGGDYFDLAEAKDGSTVSMVLSDSSSYGLSSSLLSILMKVAMKLSAGEVRSCAETVQRIHEELKLTLSPKDRLSLFYGVVSRKDYRLRFLNLGTSCAFYSPPSGSGFQLLPSQGSQIVASEGGLQAQEGAVPLEPAGRLVLVSDGFVEAAGGTKPTQLLLEELRGKDATDILNELVFKVKSQFQTEEDMPAQDCTAIVFDLDARLLRLA